MQISSVKERYDILFINSIAKITHNLAASLSDYLHIFVVHFENIPNNVFLKNITPKRRFYIPTHLFKLYCGLMEQKWQILEEEEALNNWRTNLSYIEFVEFLNNSSLNNTDVIED